MRRRAELRWNDPRLMVNSDPSWRARRRALQSWYRECRLNAKYAATGPSGRSEPVGNLLGRGDVNSDRALNFFGDGQILEYVDRRAEAVRREGGTLNRERLFRNMLSSMPMAWSVAAVLQHAEDRNEVLSAAFGIDCATSSYVSAEWAPRAAERRVGRTAFDIAVPYRTSRGSRGLLGVETKYTESPSDTVFVRPEWEHLTEECGWFLSGAAGRLANGPTNQMWRNMLLAAQQERLGACDHAHVAAVGLAEDPQLWAVVEAVRDELAPPYRDRLVALPWEGLVAQLEASSMGSFAALFVERYLDLRPLDDPSDLIRPRRSTAGSESQRLRRFEPAPSSAHPSSATTGEQLEWGRWLPSFWRTVGDQSVGLPLSPRAPSRLEDATAWWTPMMHVLLYSLGWPSPAVGLYRWDEAGRPLDDRRLALVEAVWGRHLDTVLTHLWVGCGGYEEMAGALGLDPVRRPAPPDGLPRQPTAASAAVPNPATGGCDPLHLSTHSGGPAGDATVPRAEMIIGDLGVAGPPRATLLCADAHGWYRALHEMGATLPANLPDQSWRVDVVLHGVGHLGTFRRSWRSGRWFSGQHRWHELGII